jgi:hypothetical protein
MSRKSQKGGSWGGYPDSAWGFQMNNLGNLWNQTMNSLSVQPGENSATSQSNAIVQNGNLNVEDPKSQMMSGGKKLRKRRNMRRMMQQQMMQQQMMQQQRQQMMGQSKSQSRGKKGGYWGAVLEQAAVPLVLLGLQQSYGKNHTRRSGMSHKRSFKRRR